MAQKRTKPVFLVGDIGGTNATLALVDGQLIIHKSRFSTHGIESFPRLVKEYLKQAISDTGREVSESCFSIAGPISGNAAKLTHARVVVDAKELLSKTPLRSCLVINDFEALGFAIETLLESDVVEIKPGIRGKDHPPISLIGPGTGLGKSVLQWDDHISAYIPLGSEGGHGDLIVRDEEELAFCKQSLTRHNLHGPASWEMALSGSGLVNIYSFLKSSSYRRYTESEPIKTRGPSPERISGLRTHDPLCRETFRWFERFLGRVAKNTVLDHTSTGGLYIAGGIIAKNPDLLRQVFLDEFLASSRHAEILKKTPVYAIVNNDVSLKGCVNALKIWTDKVVKKNK